MHPFSPLIETTRGTLRENLHLGAVAVVNTREHLLAHWGNPQQVVFTRSTLKPFQALPLLLGHGHRQFHFDSRELAMLCASHNGEEMHVELAQGMLAKAGGGVASLRCGCHVPLRFSFFDKGAPDGVSFTQAQNNCSGKHAGFVAYCLQHGLPLDDYNAPDHPLQIAIREAVARVVRMAPQDMPMGIDGCSAPNFAMPLAKLAYAYARLASGPQDAEFGGVFAQLSQAMTDHPELVSGTGRNDLALMRAGRGDWVSKIGADGVQCVASKSRGVAFAIKVQDGARPPLYAATIEVLEQLGWLDDVQRVELEPWRQRSITNARGLAVGERKPVFQLMAA
ncbi:asparaginase [Curvibacter sp. APW13]|uniref:asparaginase n=1 Tax=Curvibacter sp. APW13 TaxID=3077236 RepID=UPI0028DD4EAE|nr:asparaginase [Curvibacter sp. APW13]MDT8990788.1 asparaginase [Curvibacter sp. APW13]